LQRALSMDLVFYLLFYLEMCYPITVPFMS
jgi:hypothetical protein